jgi:hypothetical protein
MQMRSKAIEPEGKSPPTPANIAAHGSYILAIQRCPKCRQEVFAAEAATLVPEGMRLDWCCDLCSHRFSTTEESDGAAVA